jgi:type III restriction enzyme
MSDEFFRNPILNSPYEYPAHHWELDAEGQPSGVKQNGRRLASFVTPVPAPRKRGKGQKELSLGVDPTEDGDSYDPRPIINELRIQVDRWRSITDPSLWRVTPETARLLQHWRHHKFEQQRPFFCQVEAIETIIWLSEVAPTLGADGKRFITHLENSNLDAVRGNEHRLLDRLALKLATGAGKTTVMAMIIAWQTINAVRHPGSTRFTRGFLIVTPGITIRDRLRVLQPSDPDSYYRSRELVPSDLLGEISKAKIVITNYHAFKLRETIQLSKGGRALLQGRGAPISTLESEGQMLQRVCPELMGLKRIMALNDEAHHCYRERPPSEEETEVKRTGDDRKEAERNLEAARLWISGLEAVQRKLGLSRVVDLSATPFFLSGSGYREGALFPWTMSDFSLMDAIECGIVKLPRVPVADNIPEAQVPIFRELWTHIGKQMPKAGRGKGGELDPLSLPIPLQSALDALYGHYARTFSKWKEAGVNVPPCFIIVCNNTATSKLVYDFVSGFNRTSEDGKTTHVPGRLPLFRNFDEAGKPLARPVTLLIDSEQLESGDKLDEHFHKAAANEIAAFRREILERSGDVRASESIQEQDILREVMNTVGKEGRLGEQIRCVVSVSMLTEGWDANTVTHVLGVRAFGTQLLCEQVIGRALRRQSYDLDESGRFGVEYADVFGIPFDFTAKPVEAPVQTPRETVTVRAVPERADLEIRFPRIEGYRVELPEERLEATFNADSTLVLSPALVGPTLTQNAGIIGEAVDLSVDQLDKVRPATVLFHLSRHLLLTKWRDENDEPKLHLFGQLKAIAHDWMNHHLRCEGGTYVGHLMYKALADIAAERITAAIVRRFADERPITAIPDSYNPVGSTRHTLFTTSRTLRWQPRPDRCHLNWIICDSTWEQEFCRAVEQHPRVRAYVKNHNLGFEVPYRVGATARRYRPDFIVRLDDGRGDDDLLNLVVEIKGRRREDAKDKATTLRDYWVAGVNHLERHGRWAAAEFTDEFGMESDLSGIIEERVRDMLDKAQSSDLVGAR